LRCKRRIDSDHTNRQPGARSFNIRRVTRMSYTVQLRYIDRDLGGRLREMREWLERNGITPEELHQSTCPPGLAFRIEFSDLDQAQAFAAAFDGSVEGPDPHGAGACWVLPPSARGGSRKDPRSTPAPESGRPRPRPKQMNIGREERR
jgi:hypothetical protein